MVAPEPAVAARPPAAAAAASAPPTSAAAPVAALVAAAPAPRRWVVGATAAGREVGVGQPPLALPLPSQPRRRLSPPPLLLLRRRHTQALRDVADGEITVRRVAVPSGRRLPSTRTLRVPRRGPAAVRPPHLLPSTAASTAPPRPLHLWRGTPFPMLRGRVAGPSGSGSGWVGPREDLD